jgi:hypothetical protein
MRKSISLLLRDKTLFYSTRAIKFSCEQTVVEEIPEAVNEDHLGGTSPPPNSRVDSRAITSAQMEEDPARPKFEEVP